MNSDEIRLLSDEKLAVHTLTSQSAYSHIIERYERKLERYIRRTILSTQEDVEDILQETFIKAYVNLADFDESLKFSSWIYKIARNECINFYRKNSRQPKTVPGILENEDGVVYERFVQESTQEAEVQANITAEAVQKALLKINPKYREVIVLRYFEDKDYKEISDILKIPMGTVGTLLTRGKKQFAKSFGSNSLIEHI